MKLSLKCARIKLATDAWTIRDMAVTAKAGKTKLQSCKKNSDRAGLASPSPEALQV